MPNIKNDKKSPITLCTFIIFLIVALIASTFTIKFFITDNFNNQIETLQKDNVDLKAQLHLIRQLSKYKENIFLKINKLEKEIATKDKENSYLNKQLTSIQDENFLLLQHLEIQNKKISELENELAVKYKKIETRDSKK